MRIVVDVGDKKPYAQIRSYDKYEPEQRRDTTCPQCFAVSKHEDAISSYQAEDGSRCSYADLLWCEIETGDNTDHACHQVNEQEAQMADESLQEDTQDEEVEHIEADVQ